MTLATLRFASGDVAFDRYLSGQGENLGLTNASGVPIIGSGNGAVLDASSGTLQVSDDNVTWRAMLRGDTGAAVTALSATNVPVALNARYIRCTAGSASIRPMIGS
jgi:hypothetical protein